MDEELCDPEREELEFLFAVGESESSSRVAWCRGLATVLIFMVAIGIGGVFIFLAIQILNARTRSVGSSSESVFRGGNAVAVLSSSSSSNENPQAVDAGIVEPVKSSSEPPPPLIEGTESRFQLSAAEAAARDDLSEVDRRGTAQNTPVARTMGLGNEHLQSTSSTISFPATEPSSISSRASFLATEPTSTGTAAPIHTGSLTSHDPAAVRPTVHLPALTAQPFPGGDSCPHDTPKAAIYSANGTASGTAAVAPPAPLAPSNPAAPLTRASVEQPVHLLSPLTPAPDSPSPVFPDGWAEDTARRFFFTVLFHRTLEDGVEKANVKTWEIVAVLESPPVTDVIGQWIRGPHTTGADHQSQVLKVNNVLECEHMLNVITSGHVAIGFGDLLQESDRSYLPSLSVSIMQRLLRSDPFVNLQSLMFWFFWRALISPSSASVEWRFIAGGSRAVPQGKQRPTKLEQIVAFVVLQVVPNGDFPINWSASTQTAGSVGDPEWIFWWVMLAVRTDLDDPDIQVKTACWWLLQDYDPFFFALRKRLFQERSFRVLGAKAQQDAFRAWLARSSPGLPGFAISEQLLLDAYGLVEVFGGGKNGLTK